MAAAHSGGLVLDEADDPVHNPLRDDLRVVDEQVAVVEEEAGFDDGGGGVGGDLVVGMVAGHVVGDGVGIEGQLRLLAVTGHDAVDESILLGRDVARLGAGNLETRFAGEGAGVGVDGDKRVGR